MGLLLLLLWFAQVPERHRGPVPAELPQVSITNEGPLVIPADLVVKGAVALLAGYTTLLGFIGRSIWKKREDEVGEIKKGLATVTKAVEKTVDAETYEKERGEFRGLLADLNKKVDHHSETLTAKVDKNHGE